ncbi:MAG: hypothetical protein WCD37_10990 [Chloroflexia bacterium]
MTSNVDLDDSVISVVEELDAEPERMGRSGAGAGWWHSPRTRELVLGLLLLLGVLGWVGFSWWRDESNMSHYAQGQHEAVRWHWDEALAHYSAAQGYKDADVRATEALSQIEARDRQYEAAIAHRQTGPAAQALLAARMVQAIQPGYKDVDTIALQAEDQVYTDALSGTVVMRTTAYPPGLYYRGPDGWEYLRDSDQWSSVLSIPFSAASDKHVVYDVPGPDWIPPGPIIRSPFGPYGYPISQGSPDKVGRRLVMAALSGGITSFVLDGVEFVDLQLNPVDYNFYICGDAGVWGIRYDPRVSEKVIARGRFDGFTPTYEKIAPQAGGMSGTVARVVMPGTDGVVADFGHEGGGVGTGNGGDKILLAAHGPGADNQAGTHLYFADADGSGPSLVFSTTDTLISALLSPNDRHALVVASQEIESPTGKALVVAILLTLDGTAPPKLLQKISVDDDTNSPGISPVLAGRLTITGVFLESDAFKNKLLLGWSRGELALGVRLRLLDVSNPDRVLVETDMPYEQTGVLSVVEQPDGRTVLLYNQGVAATTVAGKPLTAYLKMLRVEVGSDNVKVGSYSVPVPVSSTSGQSTPYFMNPTLRGDYLVYSVEAFTTMPESSSSYSLLLRGWGGDKGGVGGSIQGQSVQPIQVFSRSWPARQSVGDAGPEWGVAGPGAYAYTDSQGTLHAHLYDAQVDVTLETGVGTILALNANYFYKVLY